MIKFYDILKAMHLNYSDDYFTQAITHRNIKPLYTVSGTLPITLPTKPRYHSFDDWVIYGNAEGVGERTKNLLDIENMEGQSLDVTVTNIDSMTGSIEAETISGRTYRNIWWTPEFEEGQTYILTCYVNEINNHARLTFRRKSNNGIINNAWFTSTGMKTLQITYTSESYPGGIYIALMLNDGEATAGKINVSEFMLRKANTTSDFIPYGYQVPLTVSQTGQTDKNYEIFIGDSPLGEGKTISQNTSETRITVEPDLETTISTTLENKPEMKIIYN